MCGIVGFTGSLGRKESERIIRSMASSLQYRGPDDEGFYDKDDVSLGFRRLAIIDIPTGNQPIYTTDQSIVLVFNGEIYNYQELKELLVQKGYSFRTQGDSEVLLYWYQEHADQLDLFFEAINGMFALGIWDRKRDRFLLARDRAGEKPLYYSEVNGNLVFASELKAILEYPGFKKELDRISLAQYLAHEYVPSPRSIFEGIHKLPSASYLIYGKLSQKNRTSQIHSYWEYPSEEETWNASEEELLERLDALFLRSVKLRLISDVPVGIFLSGGIDSSAVLSYVNRLKDPKEIETFSIGFEDTSFDESKYAREVAQYFGNSHHEEIINSNSLLEIVPKVIERLDEPFADASLIPSTHLSKFAKKNVTVALGGDGGDELFMGYPTFQANQMAQVYNRIPNFFHQGILKLAGALPVSMNNFSLDFKIKRFLAFVRENPALREQLWLGSFSPSELKDLLHFNTNGMLDAEQLFCENFSIYQKGLHSRSPLGQLSYWYFKTYMHNDILVKADRASMFQSLELRAPFLDKDLIEFTARLPYSYKIRGLSMKYILKKLLVNRVPKSVIKRPKKGFGIPVAKWFRGELKEWVYDLFSSSRVKQGGLFEPKAIQKLLDEHCSKKQDHRKKLWTLFIFELWRERWYS